MFPGGFDGRSTGRYNQNVLLNDHNIIPKEVKDLY